MNQNFDSIDTDPNATTRISPLWLTVKLTKIESLYQCHDLLDECRNGDEDAEWTTLFSKIVKLWLLCRTDINNLKNPKYDKLEKLKAHTVLIREGWLTNTEWVELFMLLDEAMEEMGITKISRIVPGPENAYKEGVAT